MNMMLALDNVASQVAELTYAILNKYSKKHTEDYINQKCLQIEKTVQEIAKNRKEVFE